MIHEYPSIYQIGHKAIANIFDGDVLVEEKIDGSQFSFGVIDGELICKSKGKVQFVDAPDKMFTKAIETAKELEPRLIPGWTYRGEYLEKPKHNALAYDRVPVKNIIIFDIDTGLETYLTPEEKRAEAERLGLETVPILMTGTIKNFGEFQELLEIKSILGNEKIEGVVVKNYSQFTQEKKVAMGKYVSERYKEVQSGEWRSANPTNQDFTNKLIYEYKTEARWQKAIQHAKENGLIEGSPRDIGILLKEIGQDVSKECSEEIKDKLYKYYWPKVQRGIIAGFPEWYKEQLSKSAFKQETN